MASKPLQAYVNRSGTWKSTGRGQVITPFYRFAPVDVFNKLVLPTGSLDAGTRNVGCRIPDASLSNYSGTLTLTSTSNITGLLITGPVTGRGGTVTDCKILGPNQATSKQAMAVGTSYDFGGALFEWCSLDGTGRESMWTDNLNGGNYTIRYSELLRGVDGLGFNTVGNAVAECNRIYHGHYETFWDAVNGVARTTAYTDAGGKVHNPPIVSQTSGDVHSDACQIQGYSGWALRGNYFGGPRGTTNSMTHLDPTIAGDYATAQARDADGSFVNSALIVNAIAANPVGADIQYNVFHGGAARVNLSTAGTDLLQGVTIANNLFMRDSYGFYIYAYTGHQATLANNVYYDDGTAVPVVLH